MRQEAVRVVDGLADGRADGRGTEEVVRRAVSSADGRTNDCFTRADRQAVARANARRDGRLHPACGRVGGRLPGKNSHPPGGRLCRPPGRRPADCEANG